MSFLSSIMSLMLHLDDFLTSFISQYGTLVYLLIFLVIFCETGLFVAFLPGDSFIFACAAFAASHLLNIGIVVIICLVSGFLGDTLNYYIGHTLGKKICAGGGSRFIKPESIERAKSFYDRHGGKAIVLSRFIPLVRQCTPFVAGIGKMSYERFMSYNLFGVVLWVGACSLAGYFFGNIPVIRDNFTGVILALILLSLLPAAIAFIKSGFSKNKEL